MSYKSAKKSFAHSLFPISTFSSFKFWEDFGSVAWVKFAFFVTFEAVILNPDGPDYVSNRLVDITFVFYKFKEPYYFASEQSERSFLRIRA